MTLVMSPVLLLLPAMIVAAIEHLQGVILIPSPILILILPLYFLWLLTWAFLIARRLSGGDSLVETIIYTAGIGVVLLYLNGLVARLLVHMF
jgi:hypothetical protein